MADDIESLHDVIADQIRKVLRKYPMTDASTTTVGPRDNVREAK